jgi:hypothetical protein
MKPFPLVPGSREITQAAKVARYSAFLPAGARELKYEHDEEI